MILLLYRGNTFISITFLKIPSWGKINIKRFPSPSCLPCPINILYLLHFLSGRWWWAFLLDDSEHTFLFLVLMKYCWLRTTIYPKADGIIFITSRRSAVNLTSCIVPFLEGNVAMLHCIRSAIPCLFCKASLQIYHYSDWTKLCLKPCCEHVILW